MLAAANLQNATFQEADLRWACLWRSHFFGATLLYNHPQHAAFRWVMLSGGDWHICHCEGTRFENAMLSPVSPSLTPCSISSKSRKTMARLLIS